MNKTLIRLVALVLVPCLFADPVTAQGFCACAFTSRTATASGLTRSFAAQALQPPLVESPRKSFEPEIEGQNFRQTGTLLRLTLAGEPMPVEGPAPKYKRSRSPKPRLTGPRLKDFRKLWRETRFAIYDSPEKAQKAQADLIDMLQPYKRAANDKKMNPWRLFIAGVEKPYDVVRTAVFNPEHPTFTLTPHKDKPAAWEQIIKDILQQARTLIKKVIAILPFGRGKEPTEDPVEVRTRLKLEILNQYIVWVKASSQRLTPQEIIGLRGYADSISRENANYLAKKYPSEIKKHNLSTINAKELYEGVTHGTNNLTAEQRERVSAVHGDKRLAAIALADALVADIVTLEPSSPDTSVSQRHAIFVRTHENYLKLIPASAEHVSKEKNDVSTDTPARLTPSVREKNGDGRYHTVSGTPAQVQFWQQLDDMMVWAEKVYNPGGLRARSQDLIAIFSTKKALTDADIFEARREVTESSESIVRVAVSRGQAVKKVTEIPEGLDREFERLPQEIGRYQHDGGAHYAEFKNRLLDLVNRYEETGRNIEQMGQFANVYQQSWSESKNLLKLYQERMAEAHVVRIEKLNRQYPSITPSNRKAFVVAVQELEATAQKEGLSEFPTIRIRQTDLRMKAGLPTNGTNGHSSEGPTIPSGEAIPQTDSVHLPHTGSALSLLLGAGIATELYFLFRTVTLEAASRHAETAKAVVASNWFVIHYHALNPFSRMAVNVAGGVLGLVVFAVLTLLLQRLLNPDEKPAQSNLAFNHFTFERNSSVKMGRNQRQIKNDVQDLVDEMARIKFPSRYTHERQRAAVMALIDKLKLDMNISQIDLALYETDLVQGLEELKKRLPETTQPVTPKTSASSVPTRGAATKSQPLKATAISGLRGIDGGAAKTRKAGDISTSLHSIKEPLAGFMVAWTMLPHVYVLAALSVIGALAVIYLIMRQRWGSSSGEQSPSVEPGPKYGTDLEKGFAMLFDAVVQDFHRDSSDKGSDGLRLYGEFKTRAVQLLNAHSHELSRKTFDDTRSRIDQELRNYRDHTAPEVQRLIDRRYGAPSRIDSKGDPFGERESRIKREGPPNKWGDEVEKLIREMANIKFPSRYTYERMSSASNELRSKISADRKIIEVERELYNEILTGSLNNLIDRLPDNVRGTISVVRPIRPIVEQAQPAVAAESPKTPSKPSTAPFKKKWILIAVILSAGLIALSVFGYLYLSHRGVQRNSNATPAAVTVTATPAPENPIPVPGTPSPAAPASRGDINFPKDERTPGPASEVKDLSPEQKTEQASQPAATAEPEKPAPTSVPTQPPEPSARVKAQEFLPTFEPTITRLKVEYAAVGGTLRAAHATGSSQYQLNGLDLDGTDLIEVRVRSGQNNAPPYILFTRSNGGILKISYNSSNTIYDIDVRGLQGTLSLLGTIVGPVPKNDLVVAVQKYRVAQKTGASLRNPMNWLNLWQNLSIAILTFFIWLPKWQLRTRKTSWTTALSGAA